MSRSSSGPARTRRPPRTGSALIGAAAACLALASVAGAQDPTPLARIDSLDLPSVTVGRVEAHFSPGYEERGEHLAGLTERAAAFFEDSLDLSFDIRMVVLTPEQWFSPYGSGLEPYGIPWAWHAGRLIGTPASLEEGVLIHGDDRSDRRRVDFVTLHEYGHIAGIERYHPSNPRDFPPVWWFDELVATYFAYAYLQSADPVGSEAARREWRDLVESYDPPVLSLDWSFMRDLGPEEFARTYAWYQNLLNLRAAEIFDRHGLGFLRDLKALPWDDLDAWTTASLLPRLEEIAPGFEAWAEPF